MANKYLATGASAFNTVISSKYDLRINKYILVETDSTPLFKNDFVKLTGLSDNEGTPIVTRVSSQNDTLLGFVVSFGAPPGNNIPIYREANIKRYVYVCDDPYVKFEMQVNGTFSDSDVGKNANLSLGSGNTNTGISDMQIDASTLTTNAAQVKILSLVERVTNYLGEYAKVECVMLKDHISQSKITYPGTQIYFVRDNGSDGNTGKSWNEAFKTFTKAITEVNSQTPSTTNRFSILCLDGGIYTTSFTVPEYTSIDAKNATIIGQVILSEGSSIRCRELQNNAAGYVISGATSGTETAYFDIDYILIPDVAAALNGIGCGASVTVPIIGKFNRLLNLNSNLSPVSRSIQNENSGDNMLNLTFGELINVNASSIGIISTSSGTGLMVLSCNKIEAASHVSQIVASQGGEININCCECTGGISVVNAGSKITGNFSGKFFSRISQASTGVINIKVEDTEGVDIISAVADYLVDLNFTKTIWSENINSTTGGHTVIPRDSSKPLITEGIQIYTKTFSPVCVNRPVYIEFIGHYSQTVPANNLWPQQVFFIDSGVYAVAVADSFFSFQGGGQQVITRYKFSPNSLDPIDLEVRAGCEDTGTIYFNMQNVFTRFDGVLYSTIRIWQEGTSGTHGT